MKTNWIKIEEWFNENEPEVLDTFNPGATDEELANLEKIVGFELPKDFIESYKIHNGQNTGLVFNSAIIDPESEGLSSINKIIETYELYKSMAEYATKVAKDDVDKGIKPIYWSEKWLPIMEDGMGNSYFIDLDPSENGIIGQIILRNHEGPTYELVSKSFKIWVKEYIDGNLD